MGRQFGNLAFVIVFTFYIPDEAFMLIKDGHKLSLNRKIINNIGCCDFFKQISDVSLLGRIISLVGGNGLSDIDHIIKGLHQSFNSLSKSKL